MQAGNMFIKVVTRKLQGSNKAYQFMLLAGFDPKLTHATAAYFETLDPPNMLSQESIDKVVAKLVDIGSASGTTNVTNADVQKKLDKLFNPVLAEANVMGFANMGIGRYM